MQTTYQSDEYHDEFKNQNEYEINSYYNSTCRVQKWVAVNAIRVNYYFMVGPYADMI